MSHLALARLPDHDLPPVNLLPSWMNLKCRVLESQQRDIQCFKSIQSSQIGCSRGCALLIWDFYDPEYHVKKVIWQSVCRYWLYEYLELSQNLTCYHSGLFRECYFKHPVTPAFTILVAFCNYQAGYGQLRMDRVDCRRTNCLLHYVVWDDSVSFRLHIQILQYAIIIQTRFDRDESVKGDHNKKIYGLCSWDGHAPGVPLSDALNGYNMIGEGSVDFQSGRYIQSKLYEYGFRRQRKKRKIEMTL